MGWIRDDCILSRVAIFIKITSHLIKNPDAYIKFGGKHFEDARETYKARKAIVTLRLKTIAFKPKTQKIRNAGYLCETHSYIISFKSFVC